MSAKFLTVLFLAQGILPAQEQPAAPAAYLPPPGVSTYIPHHLAVTPFAPPVPVVPKPPPDIRIDASATRRVANGTLLTLQRGEASTKPDLPPPPPPRPPTEPREPTPEQIARRIYYLRHNFDLGASVYDHRTSVVTWTDPESRTAYQAVCGFDIGLLAGIGGFIHEGERYRFMLFHSDYDTTAVRRFIPLRHPNLPEVAEGEILITRGDPGNVVGTAPVVLLGRLIAVETERLLPYQAARREHYKASRAWHAAHPPVPQDTRIILRPHRGSRYLTNPISEQP